ncbi:hypothetical protein ACHAXS_007013, partial [Conticribra weissflogii]
MQQISGYKVFTKLDISMQYYTFELNKESQMFCAIITPFGKYKYKHILLSLNCIPDFSHQIMEQVLCGLDN